MIEIKEYICSTKHLHHNGEDRNNLKKRSVRLKAFCKKATSEAYAIPGFPLFIKEIWG